MENWMIDTFIMDIILDEGISFIPSEEIMSFSGDTNK